MKSKSPNLNWPITGASCAVLIFSITTKAQAQEKKSGPDGIWTWSQSLDPGGTNNTVTNTPGTNSATPLIRLSLSADAGKLTGTLSTPLKDNQVREVKIKDGKIKGDHISFSVDGDVKGLKILVKYDGMLSGDSISGKMDARISFLLFLSVDRSIAWEAKRMPDKK